MKNLGLNSEKVLSTQLTKLEHRFEQGLLTRLDETEIQRMEDKLRDFYEIDDLGIIYGMKYGARFMRLRMRLVDEANEATSSVA